MRWRTRRVLVLAVAVLIGVGATSAAALSRSSGGPVQRVVLSADDRMRFAPDVIDVRTGTVRLTLRNTGSIPHDLEIPAFDVDTPTVSGGDSFTVTFHAARPGTYYFDCGLHTGMVGELVVRA